ncbi:radical SAM/SPASM domain-containing protein [Nonomuraea jabiensis]|uniref:Radical SAM core domain-containing protein n=1 Tax=Nonomuraea jabiensis TaxID=882448 RepID=A0A7W9GGT9_9ACTN|nr:radical SAM protein [Nonomuraea jabiensis]MBB5783559.1 uncharacterized protein [Nonomuraea jabiensis]
MQESRYNIWVAKKDAAYVYNGVSGALLRMSKGEKIALRKYLAGDPENSCSPRLLAHLMRGFMLVPDDADELSILETRYRASRWDSTSFALTVVTSLGCNFSCPYCFEAKHPSKMSEEVRGHILKVLDYQLTKISSFNVTWFGGEPLLGMDTITSLSDEFIDRCDRHSIQYGATVITNGYLLDNATCATLKDRRVESVQVGLDGPPDVHNCMRPLAGGVGTFWKIIRNLRHAVDYFPVSVRVNVDADNLSSAEELFQILANEGLSEKLTVYPGQIVSGGGNPLAPSSTYKPPCLSKKEFSVAELRFTELATRYGLAAPYLPTPTAAPCTAVRANELVVGSRGELYKCWDNVGDSNEVIGHIQDWRDTNARLAKWLKYDPFGNVECRGCVALPVCMGGCASHAFDALQYENRCGTFRHNHRDKVLKYIAYAEKQGFEGLTPASELARHAEGSVS